MQVLVCRVPQDQAVLAESGFEGTWLQTSYNANFCGRFAVEGMKYDPVKDEFAFPEAPTA